MRTFLMIAGLAGLLASSTAAFAASGPGNSDRNGNEQNRTLLADNDRSYDWGRQNNQPWNNPQGSGGYGYGNGYDYGYNSGWQDSGRYQPRWGYGHQQYQPLPRQIIRARLQHQQFRDLSNWRFNDGYYRVNAEDRYGHDVRLIVDAYTGRIVNARRD